MNDDDYFQRYQIGIVFNKEETTVRGNPKDLIAIEDTALTAEYLHDAIVALGYRAIMIPAYGSLENFRKELDQYSPSDTFIFNNCDGFNGINTGSVDVTRVIEDMGFGHTGSTADAIALCTDKVRAKETLVEAGLPTPSYQVFHEPHGAVQIPLPAIIKPSLEDGSMGIDFKSVVTSERALMNRVAYVVDNYHQPALAEKFIGGRELNVAVWGNGHLDALPIDEEDYSRVKDPMKRFLTYEAKWHEDSFYFKNITPLCPANLPDVEAEYVKSVAVKTFRVIGLRDFGRIDMRYEDGVPYVVDINDIPDLAPSSGFPRTARVGGYDYNSMVGHILDLALKREGWK